MSDVQAPVVGPASVPIPSPATHAPDRQIWPVWQSPLNRQPEMGFPGPLLQLTAVTATANASAGASTRSQFQIAERDRAEEGSTWSSIEIAPARRSGRLTCSRHDVTDGRSGRGQTGQTKAIQITRRVNRLVCCIGHTTDGAGRGPLPLAGAAATRLRRATGQQLSPPPGHAGATDISFTPDRRGATRRRPRPRCGARALRCRSPRRRLSATGR